LLRNGSYGATAGGNGNGTTATERWKLGITAAVVFIVDSKYVHCCHLVLYAGKLNVWVVAVALLTVVSFVTATALRCRKQQLIGIRS